ncbi:MAG: aminotransferase class I/II-fold pyridoxal phosphate-dependent enzyme, partial [Epsilonproteobacteria bacterium]|nr:aminotransferase class I/II-fold pyridoxal phosphate-dependent enzyme [Campylobacterota bacterium]
MVIHGGTQNSLLDFSISVNPYRPVWSKNIFLRFPEMSLKYSYIEWIEEEFCKIYGEDSVILAGATEALQILSFTLMDNAAVVIAEPCYGEYERVGSFKAKKIIKITPKSDELNLSSAFNAAKNLRKNGDKTVLIFANPNNPTGRYFRGIAEDIKELTDIGVIVIIDEAFIDFVENPDEFSNAVRIRSFTKSYGMPGIRVGYAKTDRFGKLFKAHRMPWASGASGFLFLEYLLADNGKFLSESMPKIRKEYKRFEEIGMRTDCNFGCIN